MGEEADADWQAGLGEWGEEWTRDQIKDQLYRERPVRRRRNEYSEQEYRERRAHAASSALTERERREWDLP